MRNGELSQITRDHSMIAKLVEQGLLPPDAVYTHEQKGVIYRSLGDRSNLEVDIFQLELEVGDRLLLCSDGLWDMVRDPYIEDTLLQYYDPQQACEHLVESANLAGGEDNISVVVVDIQSLGDIQK
jgi:serine/threonine protein phosphatase PrpC